MQRIAIAAIAALAMVGITAETAQAAELAYTTGSVNCRAEPTVHSPIITVIPAGAEIEIFGRTGSWYEADCGLGLGFVHSSYVAFEHHVHVPYYVGPTVLVVPRAHRVHPRQSHRFHRVRPRVSKPRRTSRAPHIHRPRATRPHVTAPRRETRRTQTQRNRAAPRRETRRTRVRGQRDAGRSARSSRRIDRRSDRRGQRARRGQQVRGERDAGRRGRGSRMDWRDGRLNLAPSAKSTQVAAYVDGTRILAL